MKNNKNKFKSKYILIIIALLIIIGVIIYFITTDKYKISNDNYSGTKLSTDENKANKIDKKNNKHSQEKVEPVETLIATYSTEILDNSSGRLTNIKITCGVINETIINPGDTFSFNDIVGKPTSEKGYQEAKVIIDHHAEMGIGGGNCQVSSTIYNAVLATKGLTVIERHEHGKPVAYVPDNQDAAVSYGSLDLKFKNDNDYKIKINVLSDDVNITASIFKIK